LARHPGSVDAGHVAHREILQRIGDVARSDPDRVARDVFDQDVLEIDVPAAEFVETRERKPASVT
jgi:hypothetical protein